MQPQQMQQPHPEHNPGQPNSAYSQSASAVPSSSSNRGPWIILAIVVIVILAVLGFLFRDKLGGKSSSTADVSDYQAIFLTNGQVYFGKLSDANGQYVTLKDIFYLQVNTPAGTSAATTATSATDNSQAQLSLVKLGQELHGPVDEMHINRDQILFYEALKSDGKVVQAIDQYNKNPNASTAVTNANGNSTQQAPSTTTPAVTK